MRQDAMPLVDIIVPAYNAARYLPAALDSVIEQTFTDWRIVLVDDGSTDQTQDLLRSYRGRLGSKLLIILKENGGLPAARNTAIEHSTAEFLALLDADDVWLPERLAESLKPFFDPKVGLTHGLVATIDSEGKTIRVFDHVNRYAEGWIAPHIFMRSVDLPCPTITFRRRCIDELGGFDVTLRATEDRDMWFRIATRFRVAQIPRVIAYYRSSPQAMTTDPYRMLQAQQQFIRKHFGTAGCGRRERRVALSRVYRQLAEALGKRKQRVAAAANALRAVGYNPFEKENLITAVSLLARAVFRR